MSITPNQTTEFGRADGRLIVIEGMDGSGKTTQVKLLVEKLCDLFPEREILPLRAPGGTELGEHVRFLVKNPDAVMNKEARFLLFMAAQAQLTQEVMIPALNRGAIVIMDRFLPSAYAYQHAADGIPIHEVDTLVSFATQDLQPDLTLLLDISVQEARARMAAEAGRLVDAFDSLPVSYLEKVKAGYSEWFLDPGSSGGVRGHLQAELAIGDLHRRILAAALQVVEDESY